MKNFLTKILNFIFPQKCIGCNFIGELLCENCLLKAPRAENNLEKDMFAPFSYKDKTIKQAIKLLKFNGVFSIACPLSKSMYDLILEELSEKIEMDIVPKKDKIVLIPVPLHEKRMRERGYNQAEIIAKEIFIAGRETFALETDILLKIKNTESQVMTREKQNRLKNLLGAFVTKNTDKIKGKTAIIIDDVVTTGATMEECSKVIKDAGARKVYCVAVAH